MAGGSAGGDGDGGGGCVYRNLCLRLKVAFAARAAITAVGVEVVVGVEVDERFENALYHQKRLHGEPLPPEDVSWDLLFTDDHLNAQRLHGP